MVARIAVEEGLENVVQALRREGFETTHLSAGAIPQAAAAVVSGMSENFLGIQETGGNQFPVINAAGLTADEVVRTLRERIEADREVR